MRSLRPVFVVILFSAVGLVLFYLTALTSGEPWRPAWENGGLNGVLVWAYERASIITVGALFLAALLCGWLMPFNALVAAVSLALFYPAFSTLKVLLGAHAGNLLLLEFITYLLFIVFCILGYGAGRWLSKRFPIAHKGAS